jgi:hypothetical protein
VLALAALGSAAVFGELVALLEFGKFLFKIHGGRIISGGAGGCFRRRKRQLRFAARMS